MPEKTPNGSAEEGFAKPLTEVIPPLPEAKTFKQEMTLWVFRTLVVLAASGTIPVGSYAVSCGVKTAELRTAAKKKQAEAKVRQRKLQLALLQKIIEIAQKADFKNPSSLYKLGLVANMVNENKGVFGIELVKAEDTLKRMFNRLSPISGLRRRVEESDVLIAMLAKKVQETRANEKASWDRIQQLRHSLEEKAKLSKGKRRGILAMVKIEEENLKREKGVRLFYSKQLYREKRLKRYFHRQLNSQAKLLENAMSEASELRERLLGQAKKMKGLMSKLKKDPSAAKKLSDMMDKAVIDVARESQLAQQTIKRLQGDLASERREAKRVKGAFEAVVKRCMRSATTPRAPTPRTPLRTPVRRSVPPAVGMSPAMRSPRRTTPRRRAVPDKAQLIPMGIGPPIQPPGSILEGLYK